LSRGNRPQPAQERSAEERERSRLQRERRRAERAGESAPGAASGEVAGGADAADAADAARGDVADIADASAPERERPVQPLDPAASEAPAERQGLASPSEERADAHAAEVPLPPPLASPRRGVRSAGSGGPRLDGHDAGSPKGPPGGRRRGASGGLRPTRARVAALLALALAAALVWFLVSLFQPFAGSGTGRVIVVIPQGASASTIGSILARDGVVSSGFFFDLRASLAGKRGSLHSGRFALKHGMSYSAAIDALSKPPPKAIVVKVVIPEGYTRRQIAQLVGEDALSGSYLAASKRSRLLSPRRYGAPPHTPTLEGFLFPATYDLTAGAPVERLVNEQLTAFRERFGAADERRARALHVTPYQLLTVASMIEREAQTAGDRPKIAAVIYNRLREGMPLGIDATIYYAVEEQKRIATYTGELTESQLKIDSPYNTRTHKGLPPTPISNPGTASIEAAAHPAHVPFLYYVAGADGCGEQVFSRTSAEFEKNVAAWDAAVKKNGGHPPACKKK
jgi:UPF0755 protein